METRQKCHQACFDLQGVYGEYVPISQIAIQVFAMDTAGNRGAVQAYMNSLRAAGLADNNRVIEPTGKRLYFHWRVYTPQEIVKRKLLLLNDPKEVVARRLRKRIKNSD